ncbi:PAS domain S-box-containing protein [Pedobacter sp. W3I1]|uniref:sensor histidine kinase n=1 Tax=Pedobacter sp. W3I1 TaxID=3042291 RepID=UPI002789A3DC|nr:PAS domain-containing sensor histidine kinase [Pedobacter sp. W3I1]MDQ0638352.1 PAS domain S-box-containing protein [Pedobacter sp. W3I1]
MAKDAHTDNYKLRFKESEDKFNSIFSLTSVASKIIGSDLTILKVNKAMVELLGYTAEEIEGTKILDYACEEYKPVWHDLQEALWSRRVPYFKLQACLVKKDASLAWVDVTTILFNDDGVTYGFTVLDDITGTKRFRETELRLNVALRNSQMAVWEMEPDGNFSFRSEIHDQIFGYETPNNQWTVHDYTSHIIDEDRGSFKNVMDSLPRYGAVNFQGRIITTAGTVKWINFQGRAERDADGSISKFLGTVADITVDKQKERHKEDFIRAASHELRTPVTTLKASVQLLNRLQGVMEEKAQTLLNQVSKSVEKVSSLIEDLLYASRAYENFIQLRKTHFNISKLIEEGTYHLKLGGPQQISIKGDLSLSITADAERIERVILSFLDNALKYAPGSKKVEIFIEQEGDRCRISVKDTGPGIEIERQRTLFDWNTNGDFEEGRFSGMRTGLYTSAEIIKTHQGEIGVLSEPGAGSTFWFMLPISG